MRTKLFPPGKRKKAGPMSARVYRATALVLSGGTAIATSSRLTSAMSTRMPFGLFLYVGGKRENIAKLMVCPAAAPPSTETKKVLARSEAEDVGRNERFTWAQVVWEPLTVAVADPRVAPLLERRPTVTVPENEEAVGKR